MNRTKHKPMTPKFKFLVAKVRLIDTKAANWLVRNRDVEKYDIIQNTDILACSFIWDDTPQGYLYWANINTKIE